jgi:hypothetical protein
MNALTGPLNNLIGERDPFEGSQVFSAALRGKAAPVLRAAERVSDFFGCECAESAFGTCERCREVARAALGAIVQDSEIEVRISGNVDRVVERAAISDVQDRAEILVDELTLLGDGQTAASAELMSLLHLMSGHAALRFSGTTLNELRVLARTLGAICDGWRKAIPRDSMRIVAAAAIDLDDALQYLCSLYVSDTAGDPLPVLVCA